MSSLSSRSFAQLTSADSWEEVWEAGPYFDRVSGLLERAERYAILVGWQVDSRVLLGGEKLRAKLIRLCESKPQFQAYLLMWDHASFYMIEREIWQGRIWDEVHPRIHFVFDNRHPFGGSHHEKICIVDGKTALCGGIDLCDERWDLPTHNHTDPRRSLSGRCENHGPYHDMGVQVTGPVCAAIQNHVARRWRRISSVPFPRPPADTGLPPAAHTPRHRVYFSRTVAPIDLAPGPARSVTREIEHLFRDLIRSAKRRIILEGQYYWSEEVNDLLLSKMIEMSGTGFEITMVLANLGKVESLTRAMNPYELSLLEKLDRMAGLTRTRLAIGHPYSYPSGENRNGLRSRPVYVHSKVLIIDDRFLSIGSANLAARALRLDTEIHLTLEARSWRERRHIREFAQRVLEHWGGTRSDGTIGIQRLDSLRHLLDRRSRRWLAPTPWPIQTWVPWQVFFDPKVSWFFTAKRRLTSLARKYPSLLLPVLAALLLCGATLSVLIADEGDRHRLGLLVYCSILSSTWLFPIPFVAISILATLQLGAEPGARAAVASLWTAAVLGYAIARAFPASVMRYCRRSAPRTLSRASWRELGGRRFANLLRFVFDPRIDMRSKILHPGIASTPFAWFSLATLLLLPAVLSFSLRALMWVLR